MSTRFAAAVSTLDPAGTAVSGAGKGPDRALVDACLRDEPGAWERFVDLVGPSVMAAVRRVLGDADRDAADDCAAEVMALCVARDRALLRGYRGEARLTTWLHVVARRVALAWRARAARAPAAGTAPDVADRRPGPGEIASRVDAIAQLRAVLDGMPERDREVLRRFYLEGQDGAAIGAALGIPAAQVSVALHRARERARNLLGLNTLKIQPESP